MRHFIDYVTPEHFMRPSYMRGYVWLPIAIICLQIRFQFALPLVTFCFLVIFMFLNPEVCSRFYNGTSLIGGSLTEAGCIWGLAVVGPLMLLWVVERRLRDNFIGGLQRDELENVARNGDAI